MELPSYSKQLLQQLYTLCKEQQFCDCTIFIGNVHFRAHKVVLAAASLLFKSLLDSTDTISIDASVMTPEEFALLLEMMYSGKLPLGKHNFTKVISVADSLQMFDVAVSCKNLLRDLISCSTQDQVVREVSSQAADSSGNHAEANNLPQSEKRDEGKTDILLPQRVSPFPGPLEAEMEADVSPGQELAMNHTWVQQNMMLSDSRSLQEDSGSCPDQPACARQGGCVEEELAEPLDEKGGARDLAAESKSCKLDFFLQYESVFSEALSDNRAVLKRLEECREIDASQKEALVACLTEAGEQSVFKKLLSKVKDAQTLVSLLKLFQDANPNLRAALLEWEQGSGEALQQTETTDEAKTLTARLLGHREELIQSVTQLSPIVEFLEAAEEGFLTASEKRVVLDCCEGSSQREAMDNLLRKVDEEKTLKVESLVKLLGAVKASFPGLHLLLDNLVATANVSDGKGLLTEGSGEKPGIRKWKVNSESQVEALDKDEDKVGDATAKELREPQEKPSSKKTFVCKACDKTFHFYCRLKVHMKRCRVARGKQIQCKECSEVKSTKKELEKHQLEVHGAKKKKKRLPVACDICGREFAHASGMQYHKLTEHFDEKPFSCEECGAKFAANSTLKNHLRLHTGDRPFMCKHCLMTFMQASALAYHTKKKHAEGKMYACQYCDAVFAQSIELSRHVRTHTGDKPYVCRECGKGFRQANGLSIHLRTFHNIEDPYDCKKCRMSFATLQEHRKHVHEAHSREYHPCPTCTKVFSAPSLLERHMVTHVGGKPFSCEICDKAYQQLSGLWYHNRTHHPDVFAAQNHRSSKFSSLQCSSCDKTFSSTAAHRKHVKTEHTDVKFYECETCKELFPTLALLQVHVKCRHSDSQLFCCLYCSASFHFPGALQNHVTSEHFKQTESTFTCKLCGELFPSQGELEGHYSAEHPKVVFSQATTAQIVQVIQTSEQGAAEHIISFDDAQLAGSQVFVTLPESQASQTGSELVAVTMEDLFDDKVTLICEEAK
ncbi:zinc finger and BTB domain-containing protein 40 isoform X8 [Harpia harpyja]|uniref:zinc finger and BTB domain-containing protein 40 isoform X8 n=1 Tax=Harpia harpyja TaxID=202280 RepID=UPI0022B0877C|nr:zinc finger and BTB domain-containing protein 40 isoform X8 [Harpia harpyja]